MNMNIDPSELEPTVSANTDELKAYIEEAYQLDIEIAELNRQLEQKGNRLKTLMNKDIPDTMDRIGTNVFGVPGTRTECRIQPFYHASIPEASKEEAFEWLEKNEHGDLIKNAMKVEFNREDADAAKRIFDRVRQMLAQEEINAKPVMDKTVHWKTLTSFIKEQVEEGKVLPLGIFGATVGRVAKFKETK